MSSPIPGSKDVRLGPRIESPGHRAFSGGAPPDSEPPGSPAPNKPPTSLTLSSTSSSIQALHENVLVVVEEVPVDVEGRPDVLVAHAPLHLESVRPLGRSMKAVARCGGARGSRRGRPRSGEPWRSSRPVYGSCRSGGSHPSGRWEHPLPVGEGVSCARSKASATHAGILRVRRAARVLPYSLACVPTVGALDSSRARVRAGNLAGGQE